MANQSDYDDHYTTGSAAGHHDDHHDAVLGCSVRIGITVTLAGDDDDDIPGPYSRGAHYDGTQCSVGPSLLRCGRDLLRGTGASFGSERKQPLDIGVVHQYAARGVHDRSEQRGLAGAVVGE